MNDILSMQNITKIYPNGVTANKEVCFTVREGEIHALMGENGAGKSTLMKILFGLESLDSGTITYDGKPLAIKNPAEAIDRGIGMVSQHFMLVESLTVYENVFLGIEPKKGIFIDGKKAKELVKEYAKKYNFKLDPEAIVEELSVSQKQKVEILKVLVRGSKLLILDEPTAVLTPQETDELFEQLMLLRKENHTIIFITHKIKEVQQIADRLTVLRGGRSIGTMEVANTSAEEISRFMVGRDVVLQVAKTPAQFGEVTLNIENLSAHREDGVQVLKDVFLKLHRGEILGVAGVEGNGQNDLAESIFGLRPVTKGNIYFDGEDITHHSVKDIRSRGIGLIPEDRMTTGVASDLTIWENLIADKMGKEEINKGGYLNLSGIMERSKEVVEKFAIKSIGITQDVNMLSGGNIQKVVVAREMSSRPKLLIANQPTRGIDVGAQEFIWKELVNFRDDRNSILLISADLNEILELSDSVIVMVNGEIVAYFEDADALTEAELGLYMLGLKKQEGREGEDHEE